MTSRTLAPPVPLAPPTSRAQTLRSYDVAGMLAARVALRPSYGNPSGPPATQPVPVYPVEIYEGDVYVSLAPSNGVHP